MKQAILSLLLTFTCSLTIAQYGSQFNSAVYLNSSIDYVNCGGADINIGNAFTVEAWIKIPSYPATGKQYTIISKISYAATSFSDFPFSLNISSQGQLFAQFSKGDDYLPEIIVVDPNAIALNTWYHIAVSFQGNMATLYRNGIVVNTNSTPNPFTLSTGTRPFTIGRAAFEINTAAGTTSYIGFIDEVRIWSSVRTQADITANMNAELVGNESGLLGYWDMNRSGQGSGLTVTNKALAAGFFPNGITSGTSTSPIFVNCIGLSPVISASGPVSFCEGGSVTLSSNASSGNIWNTGATTPSIQVTESGNYFVSRSPNTICGSLNSNTVTVNVLPVPAAPVIAANGPATFCIGDSVVLQADQANGVLWSNGQTGQSITANSAGTYTATYTNMQGCTSPPSNAVTITVLSNTYYADSDGDGYGDPASTVQNCNVPVGYVTNNSDCNDNNNQVYPGAVEYLNGVDDNCDGLVDNNAICRGGGMIFQKSLGGSADDDVASVVATTDGGFAMAGTTSSRNGFFTSTGANTRPDGWFAKLNKDGIVEWQRILTSFTGVADMKLCADGGFILAGKRRTLDFFYHDDIQLIKLSATGVIQWSRVIDLSVDHFDEESKKIIQTNDGGFLLHALSTGGQLLIKLSSTGFIQWSRYFNINADFVSTADNGFMVVSTGYIPGCRPGATNISYDIILTKLAFNGDVQWQKCFGGNGNESAASIIQTSDGQFLIAGISTTVSGDVTSNAGGQDVWLIKVDGSGNLVWQQSYGGSQTDIPVSITTSADNGFVIACSSSSNNGLLTQNQGGFDYWAFKVNSTGNLQWQRSLGGSGVDYAKSIATLNDGNYIIAGFTNSTNGDIGQSYGSKDVWLAKLMDISPQTFYADADQDGYGDANTTQLACEKPAGYVSNNGDCDDTRNTVYPGAPEICGNGIDDNCNGQTDEFIPTPALTSISGPVNVCPFVNTSLTATYSVSLLSNAINYVWQVPAYVNIVSGQGTNVVTLSFDAGFNGSANKVISVYAVTACDVSNTVQLTLASQLPGTAAAITASSTDVCASIGNNSMITYSIPKLAGAASYIWTAQAGTTTITHPAGLGINDTIIQVQFSSGFTTSNITVQAINDCGSGSVRSLTVTRNNPATPGPITGPTNACLYMGPSSALAIYFVTASPNISSYQWSLPVGVTDVTGLGTNRISLRYTADFAGGNISVMASNGCGSSGIRSLVISKLAPATPSVIDVIQESDCPARVYTYHLSGMPANAQGVYWSVPPGSIILSGQGTPRLKVRHPSTAILGTVSVVAMNACRNSSTRTLSIKLPACPPEFAKNSAGNYVKEKNEPINKTDQLSVQVFPNPANHMAKLHVSSSDTRTLASIRILDIRGNEWKRMNVMPGEVQAFGEGLLPGMYFIEVLQGTQKTIQKFVRM